jgi:hypothetical protein
MQGKDTCMICREPYSWDTIDKALTTYEERYDARLSRENDLRHRKPLAVLELPWAVAMAPMARRINEEREEREFLRALEESLVPAVTINRRINEERELSRAIEESLVPAVAMNSGAARFARCTTILVSIATIIMTALLISAWGWVLTAIHKTGDDKIPGMLAGSFAGIFIITMIPIAALIIIHLSL